MVKRDKNTEAEENIFLPIVEMLDGADGFNESAYLERRPDVAEAVMNGAIPSGLFHYKVYGQQEGDSVEPELNIMLSNEGRDSDPVTNSIRLQKITAAHSACHVDTILFSKTAGIFVVGWVDETLSEVARLHIRNGVDECVIENWKLARFRRRDVNPRLGSRAPEASAFVA